MIRILPPQDVRVESGTVRFGDDWPGVFMYYSLKRSIWNFVDFIRYSLPRGIKNLIRWFPVIWRDADWDWECLATIMEKKLRWMSASFQKYSHHTGAKKDARNMLVCAELIKRLKDDDFEGVTVWQHETRTREWQEMLGRILGKHLRSWWD